MKQFLRGLLQRFRGGVPVHALRNRGLRLGSNVSIQPGAIIDPSHCWLITIGNNVTIAPQAYILAHDASTKQKLGYVRVGRVDVGDNTFIGARSIVMPGVRVGSDVIIAAGSVVSKDVPNGSVVAGNPAVVIAATDEYLAKHREQMKSRPLFDESYTLGKGIDADRKETMRKKLADGPGYVR